MKRIPTLGLALRQFSQGQSCLRILLRNFTSFFEGKKAVETIITLFWRCNNSLVWPVFHPHLAFRLHLKSPMGNRPESLYLCGSITRSFCVLLLKFVSL